MLVKRDFTTAAAQTQVAGSQRVHRQKSTTNVQNVSCVDPFTASLSAGAEPGSHTAVNQLRAFIVRVEKRVYSYSCGHRDRGADHDETR